MNKKYYLYLIPCSLSILLIFGSSFLYTVKKSLRKDGFIFGNYQELFTKPEFLTSILFTVYIAFISSVIVVLLGIGVSYLLLKIKNYRLYRNLYSIPVFLPHLIIVFLLTIFFANVLYDQWGISIIVAYVLKSTPFVILVIFGIFINVKKKYAIVAEHLGANDFQIFRHVVLPLSWPSIATSFILIFAYAFFSYEVPFLLGPSSPQVLSLLAYEYFQGGSLMRPYSMSLNVVLLVFGGILVFSLQRARDRVREYED